MKGVLFKFINFSISKKPSGSPAPGFNLFDFTNDLDFLRFRTRCFSPPRLHPSALQCVAPPSMADPKPALVVLPSAGLLPFVESLSESFFRRVAPHHGWEESSTVAPREMPPPSFAPWVRRVKYSFLYTS